jgi:hypothetical protein
MVEWNENVVGAKADGKILAANMLVLLEGDMALRKSLEGEYGEYDTHFTQ